MIGNILPLLFLALFEAVGAYSRHPQRHSFSPPTTPSPPKPLRYFASCPLGLEEALAKELQALSIGATQVRIKKRGVEFEGRGTGPEVGYAAVIWCRIASRILELVVDAGFRVTDRHSLYDFTRETSWTDYLGLGQTLSVDVYKGRASQELSHTHFSALTIKNAIVDHFRETNKGKRPSVELDNPDLPLVAYLHEGSATIYRSLGGCKSLHKRGYREEMHPASLRETLASGLLHVAGWDTKVHSGNPYTLIDPMCGSGTFAIEAALQARNVAPGLLRLGLWGSSTALSPPALVQWPDHDQGAWERVIEGAVSSVHRKKALDDVTILANDIHPMAIKLAAHDAQRAGVLDDISFSQTDAEYLKVKDDLIGQPLVVSNPPWDRRLSSQEAWTKMRAFLRRGLDDGGDAWFLSGDKEVTGALKMKASRRYRVVSGGLELRFLHYTVYPSTRRHSDATSTTTTNQSRHSDATTTTTTTNHNMRGLSGVEEKAYYTEESPSVLRHHAAAHDVMSDVTLMEGRDDSRMNREVQLKGMTVVQLKSELKAQGLKVSGRKAELVDRLLQK